jgi:hypothetical protein
MRHGVELRIDGVKRDLSDIAVLPGSSAARGACRWTLWLPADVAERTLLRGVSPSLGSLSLPYGKEPSFLEALRKQLRAHLARLHPGAIPRFHIAGIDAVARADNGLELRGTCCFASPPARSGIGNEQRAWYCRTTRR